MLSRKLRIWFPGAMYHITKRGNRRSSIFYDDADRNKYFELLEETRSEYPFILHSYCLMTNHIHLLLETINHHPKDIMKMLNSRYAIYFNKRHQLIGHLFQGRYGAKLIKDQQYFLEVSRYIHLNPYEAQIVNSPLDYPWSSYSSYVTNKNNPHITTQKILSYFSEPRQKAYKVFVEKEQAKIFNDLKRRGSDPQLC